MVINLKEKLYIIIGDNIKKYRIKKNLSLQDLAKRTNLNINFLKVIESNGVNENITFGILDTIANVLEISMKDLFEEKNY